LGDGWCESQIGYCCPCCLCGYTVWLWSSCSDFIAQLTGSHM